MGLRAILMCTYLTGIRSTLAGRVPTNVRAAVQYLRDLLLLPPALSIIAGKESARDSWGPSPLILLSGTLLSRKSYVWGAGWRTAYPKGKVSLVLTSQAKREK